MASAPGPESPEALRALPGRELDALYADLQRRVFECYDDGELAAECGRLDRGTALDRAQSQAAPLIERARAVHAERARRLHLRARRWWVAAWAVGLAGAAAVVWLLSLRG